MYTKNIQTIKKNCFSKKKASILLLLYSFFYLNSYGQEFNFNEPLKFRINANIVNVKASQSDIFELVGIKRSALSPQLNSIVCNNKDGEKIIFDSKNIEKCEFQEINSIKKLWLKNEIKFEVYNNLIQKGFQYDLREELNSESLEYLNTLNANNLFFEDDYFEDYLYSLIVKIHKGSFEDGRPGNLSIKILKNVSPLAFILSNGTIIISTGLISTIQSEDELVGIIAHEIAHFALDHQIINYNKAVTRQKNAVFWAGVSTIIAAGTDAYLASNNTNYTPGILTVSTAVMAASVSVDILSRLGMEYSKKQEFDADKVASELLEVINYDKKGLSMALSRLQKYLEITGNLNPINEGKTHPNLVDRINSIGNVNDEAKFTQTNYLKKASYVNSYNAWLEFLLYSHHKIAFELADRNIRIGVGVERDYLIKALTLRRILNTLESNNEVLSLLSKAKTISVEPLIQIFKEEGITYLRMGKKTEAKKALELYLTSLESLISNRDNSFQNKRQFLEKEITYTKTLIYKANSL